MTYASIADLKARLGATKSTNDDALARALEAATAQIAEHTGRDFAVAPAAHGGNSRVFRPEQAHRLDIDDCVADVNTVVEYKTARTGSWTALTVDTDFIFEPLNGRFNSRTWSTESVVMINPGKFLSCAAWPSVRVTARWGWPEIPDDIAEATLLQASKLVDRGDAPSGTLGVDGFGSVVRVQSGLDRDAATLIEPFVRIVL
ncbi:MAG: hypothetical protein HKN01_01585 [Acidimicrobiia bacterium]|nr:hypothetical protein [Acidimicrobiia bacterium]